MKLAEIMPQMLIKDSPTSLVASKRLIRRLFIPWTHGNDFASTGQEIAI